MANPHFGLWRDPDGDTALPMRRRTPILPISPGGASSNHCPRCGTTVRWEVDRAGRTVATKGGRVHVCDTSRALGYLDHRDGEEILGLLRHVLNERRMYGEAV